jgi:hypothetical protein
MTVWNRSVHCSKLELCYGVLAPFDAAQAIQGLLDRKLPPESHICELVAAKVTLHAESDSEETMLHVASVMLIDGMALQSSVSAACDDALAKECARAEGRRSRCKSKFEANVVQRLESLSFQANT